MGYRLHYAKQYKVEWAGGFLNNSSYEFDSFLDNEIEGYWGNENSDEYELPKIALSKYIETIKNSDNKNKYFTDFTDKEVYEIFKTMLDDSDKDIDYLRLSWC